MYLNKCFLNCIILFNLTVKGSHIIKGKKIDVKKALSKEEMARVNARNNSSSNDNWGGDNRSAWEPTMRNFGMAGRGGGWRGKK